MFFKVAKLAQLSEFDEIIDVRSPAEFAQDHLPGARNCPVLDDEERARVGTLYCQQSPFHARRVGALLVARNIAWQIETHFQSRAKSWRPLIYCWRGGQRSGAMAIIMGQIGWDAHQLEHGYKGYRHQVLANLEVLPGQLRLKALTGPTGSGKSRLLQAMARAGHQVLDLEALANHRGSVLGLMPGECQPSQKRFESRLNQAIGQFDLSRTVYVEAESRQIGRLTLPSTLLDAMRQAPVIAIEVPLNERVRFLLEDYACLTQDPKLLLSQLARLKPLHAEAVWQNWQALAQAGRFAELVECLLTQHYDPLYQRSTARHFRRLEQPLLLRELSDAALAESLSMLYQ